MIISFILGFVFALVFVQFYPGITKVGAAIVQSFKKRWAKVRGKAGE